MNIQSSFTVYTAALHALILNPLLFAYYWLGLSWSDLEWLYFIKTKLFISKNKQQETLHQQQAAGEAKHSAENTINFSQVRLRVGRLTLRLTVADRWECSQATGLPAWRHQDLHITANRAHGITGTQTEESVLRYWYRLDLK